MKGRRKRKKERGRETGRESRERPSCRHARRQGPVPEGGAFRSCRKGRREDALALGADERRDKLRKASGRSKCPEIRRCLNGETRMRSPHASAREHIARGGEPGELKHLSSRRKRKKRRFRE